MTIRTVEPGSEIDFDDMDLAPGVRGYAIDEPNGLYIPFIEAVSEGAGDVGRFLDSLPNDRRVVFPTVLSRRLAGMLERRGFIRHAEWVPELAEAIEVWDREAAA